MTDNLDLLADAIIEDSGTAQCGHYVEAVEVCIDCQRCIDCCERISLGSRLRHQRKNVQRITLKSLANGTNLSVSFLSDIERGRAKPSLDTFLTLTDFYELSPQSAGQLLCGDQIVSTREPTENCGILFSAVEAHGMRLTDSGIRHGNRVLKVVLERTHLRFVVNQDVDHPGGYIVIDTADEIEAVRALINESETEAS